MCACHPGAGRRGHANLLCIVPILTYDPPRESRDSFVLCCCFKFLAFKVLQHYPATKRCPGHPTLGNKSCAVNSCDPNWVFSRAPIRPPRGTNTKVTLAKGHFCAYPQFASCVYIYIYIYTYIYIYIERERERCCSMYVLAAPTLGKSNVSAHGVTFTALPINKKEPGPPNPWNESCA